MKQDTRKQFTHYLLLILNATLVLWGGYYSFRLMRSKQGLDTLIQECQANATFGDCAVVNDSALSSLFGIPMGAYGLLFYIFLGGGLLFLLSGNQRVRRAFTSLGLSVAILGFLFDLVLAGYSYFSLNTFCEYCVYTYAFNFLLLGSFYYLSRQEETGAFRFMEIFNDKEFKAKSPLGLSWDKLGLLYTPLVMVITVLALTWPRMTSSAPGAHDGHDHAGHNHGQEPDWNSPEIQKKIKQAVAKEFELYKKQPVRDFQLEGTPAKGAPDAPLKIVEFADFNCGHCAQRMGILKQIARELDGLVRIYFKNFPLDGTCNPHVNKSYDGSSCFAARAVLCADEQGKFWDVHDNLFYSQSRGRHTLTSVTKIAQNSGLNMGPFKQCVQKPQAVDQIIKQQAGEANAAQVTGTPAVFVNGRKVHFSHVYPVFLSFLKELADNPIK